MKRSITKLQKKDNIDIKIGLVEAKMGLKPALHAMTKVKSRVKMSQKNEMKIGLIKLIEEKISRKLFHCRTMLLRKVKLAKNFALQKLIKKHKGEKKEDTNSEKDWENKLKSIKQVDLTFLTDHFMKDLFENNEVVKDRLENFKQIGISVSFVNELLEKSSCGLKSADELIILSKALQKFISELQVQLVLFFDKILEPLKNDALVMESPPLIDTVPTNKIDQEDSSSSHSILPSEGKSDIEESQKQISHSNISGRISFESSSNEPIKLRSLSSKNSQIASTSSNKLIMNKKNTRTANEQEKKQKNPLSQIKNNHSKANPNVAEEDDDDEIDDFFIGVSLKKKKSSSSSIEQPEFQKNHANTHDPRAHSISHHHYQNLSSKEPQSNRLRLTENEKDTQTHSMNNWSNNDGSKRKSIIKSSNMKGPQFPFKKEGIKNLKQERNCMSSFDDTLHPSWAAKKKENEKIAVVPFEGKRIVFED